MGSSGGYLEYNGHRLELSDPFRIGRSRSCHLTLEDGGASREHAILMRDSAAAGVAWRLTDLNSTNGTLVNGKRLLRPILLSSGDTIEIGGNRILFFDEEASFEGGDMEADKTVLAIDVSTRWLLLADIKGSTQLAKSLSQTQVNDRIAGWVELCRPSIEFSGGAIETFTGDGFLAAWPAGRVAPTAISNVLRGLDGLSVEGSLEFRVVLHFGVVRTGGAMASGVEKLAGPEVNFVFKAEKVIADLNGRIVVSEAAMNELVGCVEFEDLGSKEVPGFDGQFRFFAPRWC